MFCEAPWNAPTTAVTALTPIEPPSCWKVLKTELPSVRIDSGSASKPFVIVVLKPKPWPIPKST